MEITLTTPALLFPAISLLLLAFTNRYITVANVIRTLKNQFDKGDRSDNLDLQLKSLYERIEIIRYMQQFGIGSLLFASLSMFLIFANLQLLGKVSFGISLILLIASMFLSLHETTLSNKAIELEIKTILDKEKHKK
jgi:multisubunit Na+/H+ antiporter MnhG subunit